MKIAFVLPENSNVPAGGYKVVFEYANYLVNHGMDVSIHYLFDTSMHSTLFNVARLIKHIVFKKHRTVSWFKLDSRIHSHFYTVFNRSLKKYDVVVATAVNTANFVNDACNSFGATGYYFIQGFEVWGRYTKPFVTSTYSLPLKKIVISTWLETMVHKYTSDKTLLVQNGINRKEFFPTRALQNKNNTVGLLMHDLDTKRTKFGIKVLKMVRKQVPDLQVALFGTYTPDFQIPDWIHFIYKPTKQQMRENIHGQSKVYLMPSIVEGWGLTGMEAMACGSVPVASDIPGVKDFMVNLENSVLIEPDNLEGFANAVVSLLRDDDLRIKLAKQAEQVVNQFDQEQQFQKFRDIVAQSGHS